MLSAAAEFSPPKEVCLYLHPLFNRAIMQTPQTGRAQSGETQTDRHSDYREPELGRDPIHMRASSDQNPAFTLGTQIHSLLPSTGTPAPPPLSPSSAPLPSSQPPPH